MLQVLRVLQDLLDLKDLLGSLVRPVQRAMLVRLAQPGLKEAKGLLESPVPQDLKVPQAPMV